MPSVTEEKDSHHSGKNRLEDTHGVAYWSPTFLLPTAAMHLTVDLLMGLHVRRSRSSPGEFYIY